MIVTSNTKRVSRLKCGGKKRRRRGAEPIEMRERRHGYFQGLHLAGASVRRIRRGTLLDGLGA